MKRPRWGTISAMAGMVMAFSQALPPDVPAAAEAAEPAPKQVANSAELSIQGQVAHPQVFSASDLHRLASTTLVVNQRSEHANGRATYTGVLLRVLLDQVGLVDQPGRKTHLRHVVLASGRDGYGVAVALGEFDPAFANKQIMVAYARDNRPLDGLQLVVAGDNSAGRSVKDLVSLEVR